MVQVIIVDDNPNLRGLIAKILSSHTEIQVVAETGSGEEALELTKTLLPDVLVLDLELPGISGDEIAHLLKAAASPVKTLLMSAHSDRVYVRELLEFGAGGYLVKDEAPNCLAEAIMRLSKGETGWFGSTSSTYSGVTQRISPPG